jgi:hypothetical protein
MFFLVLFLLLFADGFRELLIDIDLFASGLFIALLVGFSRTLQNFWCEQPPRIEKKIKAHSIEHPQSPSIQFPKLS